MTIFFSKINSNFNRFYKGINNFKVPFRIFFNALMFYPELNEIGVILQHVVHNIILL